MPRISFVTIKSLEMSNNSSGPHKPHVACLLHRQDGSALRFTGNGLILEFPFSPTWT